MVNKATGYKVDNLGLPVWLVKELQKEFPNKSVHYAIQQILKQRYTK